MSMENKEKILVCGDVKGKFKYLFGRVETINKKSGPFELLLCVGDFFGENNDELIAYRNGFKNVPIPTYILGPSNEKDLKNFNDLNDGEICTNLTYLGQRGLYTISSGLKIAYLSGIEDATKKDWTFTKDDAVAVKNSCIVSKSSMGDYRGVDVLITSQWPRGISDEENHKQNTSILISWLSAEIRPRYHFCGFKNEYYERNPFRNPAGTNTQMELATRFISLANVNSDKNPKTKFIYALSLSPVDKMRVIDLIQKTTNETPSPYNNLEFDRTIGALPKSDSSSSQFFYDMGGNHDNRKRRNNHGNDFKRHKPNFDQEKCWFCLASKDVEKHLIISIGDSFYIALPKGPVTDGHILILSVTHIASASLITQEDWSELDKFKLALKKFYETKNQSVVFFERNYKSSHLQINAIPVPKSIDWQIKPTFDDKADEYNIQFELIPKLTEPTQLPESGPYFAAELPDDSTLLTRSMKHFPIQFGREVLCAETLLNCEEKTDWKECGLSRDDEIDLVKKFRNEFKEFDFTL